ncbi:MAG: hypothetical protein GY873_33455 [Bosea sp.]|uniref:hypothetical protein n=1 Tax=Bosea sp. (in: a-proteobacteria) TaxID=1871050 RepID=UPI00239EAAB4|nr:hypothetical protein [Bosea sp. (in: a-proteobacteria)]MCP4739100.1 hypothetical protein [Bosea sp. (in: a-proteobacteria)]
MVRLFVVLGFALLVGGAYAIVDGWPYRVLERGFTEVILGGLSLVASLILLALAAVLAEVRRLKGLVSGVMAVATLSEPRADQRPTPNPAPARPEPALDKAPEPEAKPVGIATTLAVGAGAAAVAGALTGLAKTEEKPDEKTTDADHAEKEEGDKDLSDHRAEAAAEPVQAPSTAAGEIDDWLLPPISPVLDVAPADVRPDERDGHNKANDSAEDTQDKPKHLDTADIGETAHPVDMKGDDPAEPDVAGVDEPETKQDEDGRDGVSKPEIVPASNSEDQLWWPRIDRPTREEPTSSVDDEFNALRDQLAGVVNAPEVEPPRRGRGTPDVAESWMAPRPWPPVTQPRDPGALSEVETEPADKAATEEMKVGQTPEEDKPSVSGQETASESEPTPQEVVAPVSIEADASPVEKAEPSAADAKAVEAKAIEAKPNEEPAASDEGVIGAYRVGETQFTMFADGSIHARTPDGDYVFASMDELKAYLASEKDKLGA